MYHLIFQACVISPFKPNGEPCLRKSWVAVGDVGKSPDVSQFVWYWRDLLNVGLGHAWVPYAEFVVYIYSSQVLLHIYVHSPTTGPGFWPCRNLHTYTHTHTHTYIYIYMHIYIYINIHARIENAGRQKNSFMQKGTQHESRPGSQGTLLPSIEILSSRPLEWLGTANRKNFVARPLAFHLHHFLSSQHHHFPLPSCPWPGWVKGGDMLKTPRKLKIKSLHVRAAMQTG